MSIINHKFKHIFIHVPKTAGSSIESRSFVGGSGHSSLDLLSKEKDFDSSYFKWAFVRNPYERLASAYFYIKVGNPHEEFAGSENTFQSFIEHLEYNLTDDYTNEKIYPNFYFVHLSPMSYFLKGKYEMDFIGKFENLQNDWRKAIKLIEENCSIELKVSNKFEAPRVLSHIGKTQNKPVNYMNLYSQTMKDKVYDIYREDFETYKYEK